MSEFVSHRIVPDVIPTWPPAVLHTKFTGKSMADVGNFLAKEETQAPPRVYFPSQPNHRYTLLMVDPDAPSHFKPEYKHWLHWLVINVKGAEKHSDHLDYHSGKTVQGYQGPAPPKGSGKHRYALLAYKQSEELDTVAMDKQNAFDMERKCFSIEDWFKKWYKKQPELVAGNFYYVDVDQKTKPQEQLMKHKHKHKKTKEQDEESEEEREEDPETDTGVMEKEDWEQLAMIKPGQ